jgi:ParB family chromosome partitioning protein
MEEKTKHIKKNVLGRGLGALLTDAFNGSEATQGEASEFSVFEIDTDKINTGVYQPRQYFDEEKLAELKNSIKENGIIQPLIAAKSNGGAGYDLIAGERRYRAAKELGFKKVPVIIKDISGVLALEIALIENIQRQDLNVIEEANCYLRLIEEYKLTQEELSAKVGKDRATISNMIRLLTLPDDIKKELICGKITPSHARNLIGLSEDEAGMLLNTISGEGLNVRETERRVKQLKSNKNTGKSPKDLPVFSQIKHYEDELLEKFQTRVKIDYKNKGSELKGKIEIEFYSANDLERIMETISKK